MLGVRIDEKLDKKLTALAKKNKRSKSFIAREALEMYIDEIADYEEALRRKEDPDEGTSTLKEFKKRHGL